jgi:hypothetical protein
MSGDDRLEGKALLDTGQVKLDLELGVLGKNELRSHESPGVVQIEDAADGIDAIPGETRLHEMLDGNARMTSPIDGIHVEGRMQSAFPDARRTGDSNF